MSNSFDTGQACHLVTPGLGPNCPGPGQARHFVTPGLGPNCLQRLSADDTLVVK